MCISICSKMRPRIPNGLGLASRPELGCRSYSGALCDVSAWCGERCCCLPPTSAVLPKDFTFIPPPRLLIVGAHLDRVSSSCYPPCIYIHSFGYTFLLSFLSPRSCSHTYSQLSSSPSLPLPSPILPPPTDMNTRPPIATTNRLQALSVTFNQDYSCFSVGLDNGFCGTPRPQFPGRSS